ncbi:MAG: DUF4032 domain-containing protein [Actinomycetia bacterium]|nr:DUF4032 domain-containing protein [Actinomycetes bacterium]MCP4961999.1 DUF4032 domain-containing protein [Actinomycetes bacterium]
MKTRAEPLPEMLAFPWSMPLEDWTEGEFVSLPRGLHRHVVRFVEVTGQYYAFKELSDDLARREYEMLDFLREEGLPTVSLVGIVTERTGDDGERLEGVLITHYLSYSVPYRMLFGGLSDADARDRCIDALAVLLVRAHLEGFFWGDCSLNNALFRRDAGALRAYIVDTETAERHPQLTDGQRALDLDMATANVAGGLMDLAAGGRLAVDVDPAGVARSIEDRYTSLWHELTAIEEVDGSELWRINERLARVNSLGFDTEEVEMSSTVAGTVRFRPTVVEEGHHKRQLESLTGIVAHENQARRLLCAIRGYGAFLSGEEGRSIPEGVAAYRWLSERWEPALARVPGGLRGRMEDAEVFHEILDEVQRSSRSAGRQVDLMEVVDSYVRDVLPTVPDARELIDEVGPEVS